MDENGLVTGYLYLIAAIVIVGGFVGAFATRRLGSQSNSKSKRQVISVRQAIVLDLMLIVLFIAGAVTGLFPAWIVLIPIAFSVLGTCTLALIKGRIAR